jgi:hypothetical protein
MSQNPSPTGARKDTTKNEPHKKQGPIMAGPEHTPKGRTRSHQKGIHPRRPHETHNRPRTTPQNGGQTNGIDFWHAVEFSRIKHTPTQAFRLSIGATVLAVSIYPARVAGPGAVRLTPGRSGMFPAVGGRGPTLAGLAGRSPPPIGARTPGRCPVLRGGVQSRGTSHRVVSVPPWRADIQNIRRPRQGESNPARDRSGHPQPRRPRAPCGRAAAPRSARAAAGPGRARRRRRRSWRC